MVDIDARGLSCPQPVLLVRKALKEAGSEIIFSVLVDSESSRDNVARFAASQECLVETNEIKPGLWELTLSRGFTCHITPAKKDGMVEAPELDKGLVVYINSDRVGMGDDELGKTLMRGFIQALAQTNPLPGFLVFANGGVFLNQKGSDVAEDIGLLADKGVEILTCGTCVDFFDLKESLAVGIVSNGFEILQVLMGAGRVVTP